MELEKGELTEEQKHQAALEHLEKLEEKLHSDNISRARKAAFNLSWMQEDGMEILKKALLGNFPRTTKKAAAYGLRSMNGRMKALAKEILTEGLKNRNRTTKAACEKSLFLMEGGVPEKPRSRRRSRPVSGNRRITEIRSQNRRQGRSRYNRATPAG